MKTTLDASKLGSHYPEEANAACCAFLSKYEPRPRGITTKSSKQKAALAKHLLLLHCCVLYYSPRPLTPTSSIPYHLYRTCYPYKSCSLAFPGNASSVDVAAHLPSRSSFALFERHPTFANRTSTTPHQLARLRRPDAQAGHDTAS